MEQSWTALISQDEGWWIGWIAEVPGVNAQERTRTKLLESLAEVLREALEMNRRDAIAKCRRIRIGCGSNLISAPLLNRSQTIVGSQRPELICIQTGRRLDSQSPRWRDSKVTAYLCCQPFGNLRVPRYGRSFVRLNVLPPLMLASLSKQVATVLLKGVAQVVASSRGTLSSTANILAQAISRSISLVVASLGISSLARIRHHLSSRGRQAPCKHGRADLRALPVYLTILKIGRREHGALTRMHRRP